MSKRLGAMAKADVAAGRDPGKKASYALVVNDAGKWTGVVPTLPAALVEPFGWRKPRTVFVDSMSDLFWGDAEDLADARRRGVEDPQAVPFAFIAAVFGVMDACPQHTFQVLTKRPGRMVEFFDWIRTSRWEYSAHSPRWSREATLCNMMAHARTPPSVSHPLIMAPGRWPLENVVLMTSVENQKTADERVPLLLRCPATRRGLSMEPLLGPVDLTAKCPPFYAPHLRGDRISWVIVGGESGPTARPMHPAWARSLRDQCQAAGVPFFFKQWGEWVPMGGFEPNGTRKLYKSNRIAQPHEDQEVVDEFNGRSCTVASKAIGIDGRLVDLMGDEAFRVGTPGHPHVQTFRVGKHAAGRLLDGVEHNAMPPAIGGGR